MYSTKMQLSMTKGIITSYRVVYMNISRTAENVSVHSQEHFLLQICRGFLYDFQEKGKICAHFLSPNFSQVAGGK